MQIKRWLIGIMALIGAVLLPGLVTACGGFFCTTTPIDQNAERIIFAVNSQAQTITAVVGISYTGAAEDFSWVVPVPSPPEVDVAETQSLNLLDAGTQLQINNPPNYCNGLLTFYAELGGGGGDDYLELGSVGPYDYVIIRNQNPGEMVGWLRQNGYRVTDEMIPIIVQYVDEGMFFLAMKLSQDAEVGDIQPVVMTYKSNHPMIPIRLTAVAAVPDMPIITWIFGDTQYVPENYAHPTPDYSRFRNASQIISFQGFDTTPTSTLYSWERNRLQDEYDGLAFITEFAQPSTSLPPAVQDDQLMSQLIQQHPYVTRLRAQMSPEQMTLDPTFIPAQDAPDVSNQIELVDYVDPLEYWGCGTSRFPGTTNENLLTGFTRIPKLHFQVGHPADWVLSQFEMNGQTVWAVASKTVDADEVNAYFSGKETAPMLIWMHADSNGYYYIESLVDEFRTRLGLPGDAEVYEPEDVVIVPNVPTLFGREPQRMSLQMRNDLYFNYRESGVLYALLADESQWIADHDLFTAMMEYPQDYRYFAHPNLQHTLFIGSRFDNDAPPAAYMGYPEGWKPEWREGMAAIVPENAGGDSVSARLIPFRLFHPEDADYHYALPIIREGIVTAYGLEGEQAAFILESQSPRLTDCQVINPPMPFTKDGRKGYISLIETYLVEASAPEAVFAAYDDTLWQIAESAGHFVYLGCR